MLATFKLTRMLKPCRKRNLLRAVNSRPLLTNSRERHAMGGAAASRHGSKLAAHPPY